MAQTPWGDLPVNDAHVHFFSHRFYSGLAKQAKAVDAQALGPVLGWDIPATDPVLLAEQWISELDRHGVGRVCLIGSAPGDEESVSAGVSAYPQRFFGYFMLDPLQPDSLDRVKAASA
ncbi:MAG: hypothetical protein JO097_10265, partial [Acidobacteriaceae bacterium]|nr:hypothetical protein [Acidobacteriaceae bacterium]